MEDTLIMNNINKLIIESINNIAATELKSQWNHSTFYQYAFNSTIDTISADKTLEFRAHKKNCDETIGYIQVYTTKNSNILWIQTIAIQENHIHKGYGTELYHQVLNHISLRFPIDKIYLACHDHNHIGLSFWNSLGFEQDSTINYHKDHAIIMMNHHEIQGEHFE